MALRFISSKSLFGNNINNCKLILAGGKIDTTPHYFLILPQLLLNHSRNILNLKPQCPM